MRYRPPPPTVYGLGGGDGGDEVDAVGARLGAAALASRRPRRRAERAGDRAGVADQAGQPAGVDAGDPGDPVAPEHGVEVALGPPVARPPGQLADDDALGRTAAGPRSRWR